MQIISAADAVDTPEQTGEFLADELQRNAELIEAANIKPE